MPESSDIKATLTIEDGPTLELPVYKGTIGPDVIDVSKLTPNGHFTFDPGFVSTASCESQITFIDGGKGVLLHRGYPIEQLAKHSSHLEACYLLIYGELPTEEQKAHFEYTISRHTMVHEQLRTFYSG
ncbi:MAG TPA: citrate (Si)-synthase, partial [Cellvibrionales bacterium]|nr:citrate (Si)-synthase [Cellvibrionales bacterium]